jgi:hypothetical protein
MQLSVEQVTTAKTGKSLRVKANGEWYGAKKDSGITAGTTIEAEVSDGDYGKWIDKWKAVEGPNGSKPAPHVPTGAPAWGNFVSNQVAHAIQAGLITSPDQIKVWAAAAKTAYEELA